MSIVYSEVSLWTWQVRSACDGAAEVGAALFPDGCRGRRAAAHCAGDDGRACEDDERVTDHDHEPIGWTCSSHVSMSAGTVTVSVVSGGVTRSSV